MMFLPEISRTHAQDTERIVQVWESSVRATHNFISEDNIEFFRPLVREGIQSGIEIRCVRDNVGEVIAFVAVADSKIEMLFVHPDWRGQGLGHLLIRYVVDQLGATEVDVNEQNEQAVGFYRRMGFVVQSRSELDGMGKPFPLLHMKLEGSREAA